MPKFLGAKILRDKTTHGAMAREVIVKSITAAELSRTTPGTAIAQLVRDRYRRSVGLVATPAPFALASLLEVHLQMNSQAL
jgi:hypothetical protein